jgi:hypothetical protein
MKCVRIELLEAIRTRRTPFSYSKGEYSAWSSRFASTVPIFPQSSSLVSHIPYQLPVVGPTRQFFNPSFTSPPPSPPTPPQHSRPHSLASAPSAAHPVMRT